MAKGNPACIIPVVIPLHQESELCDILLLYFLDAEDIHDCNGHLDVNRDDNIVEIVVLEGRDFLVVVFFLDQHFTVVLVRFISDNYTYIIRA